MMHGAGHQQGHDREMECDGNGERGCRSGDARTRDRAEAEERVHERHEGPADLTLGLGALDVHHHVDGAVAESEQGEADHDERHRRCDGAADPDEDEADGDRHEHPRHAEAGTDPCHEPGGDDEAEHRCRRAGQDDEPDPLGAESDVVADRREPGHPAREAEPREEEDGEDRIPPRDQLAPRSCGIGLRELGNDGVVVSVLRHHCLIVEGGPIGRNVQVVVSSVVESIRCTISTDVRISRMPRTDGAASSARTRDYDVRVTSTRAVTLGARARHRRPRGARTKRTPCR